MGGNGNRATSCAPPLTHKPQIKMSQTQNMPSEEDLQLGSREMAILMKRAKESDQNHHLCLSCTIDELRGRRPEFGCRRMVAMCIDRMGPPRWVEGNIVLVCCLVAQIARSGDPQSPQNQAKMDNVMDRLGFPRGRRTIQ